MCVFFPPWSSLPAGTKTPLCKSFSPIPVLTHHHHHLRRVREAGVEIPPPHSSSTTTTPLLSRLLPVLAAARQTQTPTMTSIGADRAVFSVETPHGKAWLQFSFEHQSLQT